jgi:predicted nucleic acid-binding protein
MNPVFVDTSAFYAVLDRDDANHPRAAKEWERLLRRAALVTNNYVLVETSALLQHRLGLGALRAFSNEIVPLLQVEWVTLERHGAAVDAVLAASRKRLSLVDCAGFQTMRECGLQTVFCFDSHFREQGFQVVP